MPPVIIAPKVAASVPAIILATPYEPVSGLSKVASLSGDHSEPNKKSKKPILCSAGTLFTIRKIKIVTTEITQMTAAAMNKDFPILSLIFVFNKDFPVLSLMFVLVILFYCASIMQARKTWLFCRCIRRKAAKESGRKRYRCRCLR